MVHQFGHVLGLPHTNRVTSAMVPYYYDWISEHEVVPDNVDIDMASHKQLHNNSSFIFQIFGVLLCCLIPHIYLFILIWMKYMEIMKLNQKIQTNQLVW